jgi:hypothetical protein
MSTQHRVLSAFIAFHVTALALASLPLGYPSGRFIPSPADASLGATRRVLDGAAAIAYRIERAMLSVSAPLRPITRQYIAIGLGQRWNMFSNPATAYHYLRIDHYVAGNGIAQGRVYRELVFPADDETRVRLGHRFRDKAIFSTIEAYFTALEFVTDTSAEAAIPETFAPVARHFARAFRQRTEGIEGPRQTEVWLGLAPMAAPGSHTDAGNIAERVAALARYRRSPSESEPATLVPRRLGTRESDGDLMWTLVYAASF